MDEQKLVAARRLFQKEFPEFKSFSNPGRDYIEREDSYKRQASQKAREILGPMVQGEDIPVTDAETRKIVLSVTSLTNFLNWRDRAYIDELMNSEDGAWREFLRRLIDCLRESPGEN